MTQEYLFKEWGSPYFKIHKDLPLKKATVYCLRTKVLKILAANELDCIESGTMMTFLSASPNNGEIDVGEIVPLLRRRNNTVGKNID